MKVQKGKRRGPAPGGPEPKGGKSRKVVATGKSTNKRAGPSGISRKDSGRIKEGKAKRTVDLPRLSDLRITISNDKARPYFAKGKYSQTWVSVATFLFCWHQSERSLVNAAFCLTLESNYLQDPAASNDCTFTAGGISVLPCQQHRCPRLPAWIICFSTHVACTPLTGHAGPQLWFWTPQHATWRQFRTQRTRHTCTKSQSRLRCLQTGQQSSSTAVIIPFPYIRSVLFRLYNYQG